MHSAGISVMRIVNSIRADVDECAERIHNCSSHASCSDRDGDYSCRCIAGYHGNGFNCRIGKKTAFVKISIFSTKKLEIQYYYDTMMSQSHSILGKAVVTYR